MNHSKNARKSRRLALATAPGGTRPRGIALLFGCAITRSAYNAPRITTDRLPMSVLALLKFDLLPVSSAPSIFVNERGEVYKRMRYCSTVLTKRKLTVRPDGYLVTTVQRNKRPVPALIHRLVCEAFHGPAPGGLDTRHLDGIRAHNFPSNLCWGTPLENSADAIRHGRLRRGEATSHSKLKLEDVQAIRCRLDLGHTMYRIAKDYGIDPSSVTAIRDKKSWGWLPEDRVSSDDFWRTG